MNVSLSLARLAGARTDLLRDTHDVPKYATMGGVIVSTAVVAALSATYALTTSVQLPVLVALLVGIGWGVVVLNLDRMLVVSMGRQNSWWRNLASAVPRVLLAVVIGTIISMPLVLRIFQPEIDTELVVMQNEDRQRAQAQIDETFQRRSQLEADVARLQAEASGQARDTVAADPEVASRQREFDAAQSEYEQAERDAICELQGPGCDGGSGRAGSGELYEQKQAFAEQKRQERDAARGRLQSAVAAAEGRLATSGPERQAEARDELTEARAELDRLDEERRRFEISAADAAQNGGGLLARLEALERLSENRPMMQFAHLAVFALFLCIELLPIVVKLLGLWGKPNVYEQRLEDFEAAVLAGDEDERRRRQEALDDAQLDRARDRARLEQDRAHLEEEADNERRLRSAIDAYRTDKRIEAGKKATDELIATQELISKRNIDVWAQVAMARTEQELHAWHATYGNGQPFPGQAAPTLDDHVYPMTVPIPVQATAPAGSTRPTNGSAITP